MKDYYELLGIERDAGADEIKAAYFKRVRTYPPERFPEEYKTLRKAREVLSDPGKRAAYDSGRGVPEGAWEMVERAQAVFDQGRFDDAATAYEALSMAYPDVLYLKAQYARALAEQGKSGTAAKVWEALCKAEPDNAAYQLGLGRAYHDRGWRKKAMVPLERGVCLDEGNATAWMGLIACCLDGMETERAARYARRAVTVIREDGGVDMLMLFVFAYTDRLENDDDDGARALLERIERVMERTRSSACMESEQAVGILLQVSMVIGNPIMIPHIRRLVALLPCVGDELSAQMEDAGDYYDVHSITEKGYGDLLHDLLAVLLDDMHDEMDRLEMAAMELAMLETLDEYRPQIARLKRDFPRLYERGEAFFKQAMATSNPEKMIMKRVKMLEKARYTSDFWGEQDEEEAMDWIAQETVRREEPKVGRNDLCPCGSGKKYKRCCGA